LEKVIRALEIQDLPILSEFFCRMTPYERGLKFVNWFYLLQCPSFLAFGAWINDVLVGSVSVVEREIALEDGSIIKCGLSVHALINPEFQENISIFELTKPLYKRCGEVGMKLVLGYPNKNFYFIQEKIDKFKEILRFSALTFKSEEVKDSASDIKFELISEIHSIAYYLGFQLNKNRKKGLHFQRSLGSYLYRTFLNPESKYLYLRIIEDKDIGFIVLKEYKDNDSISLHLVDYFLDKDKSLELVITELLFAQKTRCDKFVFWPLSERLDNFLREYGFKDDGFETYFGCKNLGLEEDIFQKITNRNNWQMAMIDSDVF
jgi:hypothetical protein